MTQPKKMMVSIVVCGAVFPLIMIWGILDRFLEAGRFDDGCWSMLICMIFMEAVTVLAGILWHGVVVREARCF